MSEKPKRPKLEFDENGHAIAPVLTEAERQADREAFLRMMADLASIPDDDPPGSDQEFFRAIDEGRPDRPLFKGMY